MESFYDVLAFYYDTMQSDMDAPAWAEFLDRLINRFGKDIKTVCDLGCGTGSVDVLLAGMGYEITGIDNAPAMLSMAAAKENGDKILWVDQDITEFEVPGKFDCFLSLMDTVDHIMDEAAVRKLFADVSRNLRKGGLFVFDCITEKHLKETLGDNVFYEDYDDFTLLWVNGYDEESRTNTADLTLFECEEDGRYVRYDGALVERFYEPEFFTECAKDAGLSLCGVFDELEERAPAEDSERIFMVFRKGEI